MRATLATVDTSAVVTAIVQLIGVVVFGALFLAWLVGLAWFFWRLCCVMWRDLLEMTGRTKVPRGFAVEVKREQ